MKTRNTEREGTPPTTPGSPRRIQRRRAKGWRTPENTVNVARPSRWGNPWRETEESTRAEVVEAYRTWLTGEGHHAEFPRERQRILDGLPELRGKNLACYCQPGTPCHADLLIALANAREH